jgi:uncharacterized protein DUF429
MSSSTVHIGIDLACARGKALPICVISAGPPVMPLRIPDEMAALIPRGMGNREINSTVPFREAARGVAAAISRILSEMNWAVERIAVDAPAAPPTTGARASENQLGSAGLSSFRTPPATRWGDIREACVKHLEIGGSSATLPYANKLWMLFGFELFAALRLELQAEVMEVYPFAIVRALLPSCAHKSTPEGYRDQLAAIAARTGWEPQALEAQLKLTVLGSRHDRLDAFMAAWVASLPPDRRRAFGDARNPDDAIWVPL